MKYVNLHLIIFFLSGLLFRSEYRCHICSLVFYDVDLLATHLSRVHPAAKVFRCQVCGKIFQRRGSLTIHMFTHTGERPFVCEVCRTAFSDPSNLKKHRLLHTRGQHHVTQSKVTMTPAKVELGSEPADKNNL